MHNFDKLNNTQDYQLFLYFIFWRYFIVYDDLLAHSRSSLTTTIKYWTEFEIAQTNENVFEQNFDIKFLPTDDPCGR